MESAFVLIICDNEKRNEVKKELEKINEVKQVDGVYGIYDFIAKIESDSREKLQDVIKSKVRAEPRIISTTTLSLSLS